MCYQQELFAQKTPYLQWIKEQEQLNKPAVTKASLFFVYG